MLVLSRKTEESVELTVPPSAVAQTITVKILRLPSTRSSVRLGFEAPADIKILRSELQDQAERAA